MATWPLRDRKTAEVAEWGEGGGEEGGGGVTEWRGGGGFVPWGGWRRQSRGEGVNRRRRQASFLIKTDRAHQPYQNLVACLHKTTNKNRWLAWPYIRSMPHLSRNYDRLHTTKYGKIKMGRGWERGEGEKGGGGGEGGETERGISAWSCLWWNMDHHRHLVRFDVLFCMFKPVLSNNVCDLPTSALNIWHFSL